MIVLVSVVLFEKLTISGCLRVTYNFIFRVILFKNKKTSVTQQFITQIILKSVKTVILLQPN